MKKRVIVSFLAVLAFHFVHSQASFEYEVRVIGKGNAGQSNVKVWLEEKNTHEKITKNTNYLGCAVFVVGEGYWSLNLTGLTNYKEFNVGERVHGKGSVTVFYDLARIRANQEFREKRGRMTFREVTQKTAPGRMPPSDSCILRVQLLNADNRPVPGIPVDVVSVKHGIKISGTTPRSGMAAFTVPLGGRYAVDVEGVKNFEITKELNRQGIITVNLEYEPTIISETVVNDTVIQQITKDTRATTARSLFGLNVVDEGKNPVRNDAVYLHEIGSNRVFRGMTDDQGKAVFLLPNGSKYMLHFDYQRDVDVYNFVTVTGRGSTQGQVMYRPDPALKYPERYIPAPEELFVESFKSFITRQLPEPEDKVGIFPKWGNNRINSKSRHAVLEIGISVSQDIDKVREIEGINIGFVIDRSGSMAGYDRIESLKESMIRFVDNLRPQDKVTLVTFNTNAFLDMPMEPLSNKEKIRDFIRDIEPGGGTNINNGMVIGYEELLKHYDPARMNRLILLTDGYGATEPKMVVEKSKEYNEKGIGISAIGVGDNYNSALLTLLTDESGGLMMHAGISNDIYTAFEQQLYSMIFPVAKEARLKIRYNPKIRFNHIYGMPVKEHENDEVTIEIGNLFMGQNDIALAQFDLHNPTPEIEEMPVIIEISYWDLVAERRVEYCEQAFLTWDDEDPQLEMLVDQEQKKLYAIAVMNQSMKVMADAFAEENIPKARYTIERAFEQMKELYPGAKDEEVEKLVAQMANYSKALDNFERKQKIEQNR